MYNNSPQAGLAALTASPYADSDVMNVRMTPREVAGLQQLAMSYGANERDLYDPMTGQPRFSFLKKILPMIAGAVLPSFKPFAQLAETVGFGSQALGTSLLVGGATGLIEGDLKKGLMAGLGAYSGAKISEGLSASASKVGGAAAAPATESTVQTAPTTAKLPGIPSMKDEILGGPAPRTFDVDATRAANWSPTQAADIVKTVTPRQAPTGFFGTMGQGISGLMKPEGRTAFMEALGGPISKSAVFMGAVDALTPTPKPFPTGGAAGEDIVYIPGGFNPQYGTGRDQPYQLPGRYYKRTPQGLVPYNPFQLAPGARGFATGGPVQAPDQNLNQQRAFPHPYQPLPNPNQNYPLSTVVQANYQSNVPQPREVVSGYEPKIDPYTGEEKFAEGGMVPGGPETFTPISVSPYAAPTTDQNVLATRAYIQELNRRARTPYIEAYPGGTSTGGLGGFGTPGIVQPGTGGAGGGDGGAPGSDLGALAGSIAGSYLINKGIGAGVDYLRDKFFPSPDQLQEVEVTGKRVPTSEGTGVGGTAGMPQVGGDLSNLSTHMPTTAGLRSLGTLGGLDSTGFKLGQFGAPIDVAGGAAVPDLSSMMTPSGSIASQYGGMRGALDASAGAGMPTPAGIKSLPDVSGVSIGQPVYDASSNLTGFRYPDGSFESLASTLRADPTAGSALAKAVIDRAIATPLDVSGVLKPSDLINSPYAKLDPALYEAPSSVTADLGSKSGLGSLQGKIIPGLQTALGAYSTAKAIEAGKEGQAALSAAGTAASAAKLLNIGALGGPVGMAAAAALAAIGASLVNTKEMGDVALRNYWNAVDKGRGIGQTDPNELAQGFINFYRTNKNEFPGQAKYGRTGNEDFMYDMTQVINNAVKEGKVDKNVDPATMYKQVVQPWLNTMGEGPKNEDAKRIQDFMMTDIINSFMSGAPISNSQVKGDKKYKLVSEKPVYAGTPPSSVQMYGRMPTDFQGRPGGIPESAGRGGSFVPVNPFEGRESVMPVLEGSTFLNDPMVVKKQDFDPGLANLKSRQAQELLPVLEGSTFLNDPMVVKKQDFDPGLANLKFRQAQELPSVPFMPPQLPGININEGRESVMPVGGDITLNPYGFAGGGAIGEEYNFGFARGGTPEYLAGGKLLKGPGDGMSDSIPAVIRGKGVQRAALADGEFVIPADVVSHLGNGSTNAGAKKLYAMMNKVRQARTGRTRQAPAVKTDRYLPA